LATVASLPFAAYLPGSSDRSRGDDKALPAHPAATRSAFARTAAGAEVGPAPGAAEAAAEQRARRLIEAWTRSAGERLARR